MGSWGEGSFIRGNNGGDEELRTVGVLAGIGHGQLALLGVLELEVLIGELVAVDYWQTNTGQLNHPRQAWHPANCYLDALFEVDLLDLPPVPSPLVKSPPWIMKFLMTRWKVDPS